MADLAGSLLARLEGDKTLMHALRKLGLTPQHLMPETHEADSEQPAASKEIAALRAEHMAERRRELAHELEEEYQRQLKAEQERQNKKRDKKDADSSAAGNSVTSVGSGAADASKLLAKDARKIEQLARRRQEEIAKMLDFQLKQREAEQKNAEAREEELAKAEAAKIAALQRERDRMEAKRLHEEKLKAAERAQEVASEVKRKADRERQRERQREEQVRAKAAKIATRKREEEQKAKQARQREATVKLFADQEERGQQRAAEAEARKQKHHEKYLEKCAQAAREKREKQAKARERVEAARQSQVRIAQETRRAFEEREAAMEARFKALQQQADADAKARAEEQLAMAMRRGKIFETMRSEEAGRVYGLLERFGKQEVAMEGMAEERRRLAELREEKRRLKQSDIQDNVQRSMRAMQYRNEDLKAKFAMEDERELARRAGKAQLVEDNMKASLASTFERQELMDKLAKARGPVVAGGSADPNKPHPHEGILKKYDLVPPSQIGLKNLGVSDEDLRQGQPVLRKIDLPGGWLRSVSVQDVHAPESVVWSAINDLDRYPKMVDGVVACDVYSKEKKSGAAVTCARYKLKAAGFTLTYYMKHIFDAKKHCMTFHLDYSRSSDLSDSVGYWYVEDRKDGWCRVYYSTDSKLPKLIPGFAKEMITNMAAKRSTSWVDARCNELTGYTGDGAVGSKPKRRPKWLGKMMWLLLLGGAFQLRTALA